MITRISFPAIPKTPPHLELPEPPAHPELPALLPLPVRPLHQAHLLPPVLLPPRASRPR